MRRKFLTVFSMAFTLCAIAQPEFYPIGASGLISYIDTAGNEAIAPMFSKGRVFSEGLAAVSNSQPGEETKWNYISSDIRIVVKTGFYDAGDFSEGLARVKTRLGWSFIDKTGDFAFDGIFDSAGDFHNGYARVKIKDSWGLINTQGNRVIKPSFKNMLDYSGNMLAVQDAGGSWVYITLAGGAALRDTFEAAGNFSEGWAPVKKKGKWYFIDQNGKTMLKDYSEARSFYRGIACVKKEGYWFFIDKNGTDLFTMRFLMPVDFVRSLAWAQTSSGLSGYLNSKGVWIYSMN